MLTRPAPLHQYMEGCAVSTASPNGRFSPWPSPWKKKTSASTRDFADGLREDFPATAAVFDGMRKEESGHRRRLIELSPGPLRRSHPADPPPGREGLRQSQAGVADPSAAPRHGAQTGRHHGSGDAAFLRKAAARASDAGIRQLLDDLAQEERSHETAPTNWSATSSAPDARHTRMKPTAASSCCKSCSPAWPA